MITLKKLYVEPSSACNLNCTMCFRNGWIDENQGLMPDKIWEKIADSIPFCRNLCTVMFAGMGEPLMNPRIFDMIKDVSSQGINTCLISNGTLLNHNCVDKLLGCGLDMLWVSVDGFSKDSYEKIQRGSQYELIYKNLLYFTKHKGKCRLGIAFVIMRENLCEIRDINRFADSVKADEINLSYAIANKPINQKDTVYDSGIPVGKMKRLSRKNEKRKKNFCPFIEDGMTFIKSNGDVCPCMQLLHSSYTYLFEEKRKVLSHNFGNIAFKRLDKIWNDENYADFRNRVHNFEFPDCTLCDGCDDRLENESDCMYNSFPTCGACLWAQGVARCP